MTPECQTPEEVYDMNYWCILASKIVVERAAFLMEYGFHQSPTYRIQLGRAMHMVKIQRKELRRLYFKRANSLAAQP